MPDTITKERMEELLKVEEELKKAKELEAEKGKDVLLTEKIDKIVNAIVDKLHPKPAEAKFVASSGKEVSRFEIGGKNMGFGDFLLNIKGGNPIMKAALSTTSAQGGYTIPAEWYNEIINIISNTSQLLPKFRSIPMSTTPLHLNSILTDVTTYIATEASAKSVTKPTFSQADLALKYIYAIISATQELNSDTAISLDSYLKDLVGQSIARLLEDEMLEGTTMCTGLLTATGVNAVPQVGGNLAYDDLVDVVNNTGQMEVYKSKSSWILNRTAMSLLMKLVDNNKQPLWSLNLPTAGQPATILGYPYIMSDQIASGATTTIYFGDPLTLWLGHKIGEEGLSVLFSNTANDGTYNYYTQNIVGWRFELRRAELPAIPAAFVRLTGVK